MQIEECTMHHAPLLTAHGSTYMHACMVPSLAHGPAPLTCEAHPARTMHGTGMCPYAQAPAITGKSTVQVSDEMLL